MNNNSIDLTGIKHIIFDFGRVLLNIDPLRTQKGLMQLGYRPDDATKGAKDDQEVIKLETGEISSEEFIDSVLDVVQEGVTGEKIIEVWNAMLLDFPDAHIETLKKLRKDYNLYLLSNSNQIHYDSYIKTFREAHSFELADLFARMWFSFQLGMIKPDPAIFRYVLADGGLKPEETLFIDDTLVHVEAARSVGLKAFHLSGDNDISNLL